MLLLVIKASALFLAGLIALAATRRTTASLRHLLCVCTLTGSLLLPATALLPSRAAALRIGAIDAAVAGSDAMLRSGNWHWSYVLAGIWALGSAILLIRLALGHWRVSKLILSSGDVSVPVATGLFRPIVLLPRTATEWPEWQRNAALRHERAHIERKDLWANFAASLASALYWFHPLVWVLSIHLRREQEAACDDTVLNSGFDPASILRSAGFLPGCAMTTQTNLKSRIARLLDRSLPRHSTPATLLRTALVFAGIFGGVALLSPVHAQTPYKVGGDVTSPRVVYKVDPPYTEEARAAKISGTVILSMVIGTDGFAHDVNVKQHLDEGLDRSATETVQQWRFAPGTLKGEPVPVEAVVEINFRLQ